MYQLSDLLHNIATTESKTEKNTNRSVFVNIRSLYLVFLLPFPSVIVMVLLWCTFICYRIPFVVVYEYLPYDSSTSELSILYILHFVQRIEIIIKWKWWESINHYSQSPLTITTFVSGIFAISLWTFIHQRWTQNDPALKTTPRCFFCLLKHFFNANVFPYKHFVVDLSPFINDIQ